MFKIKHKSLAVIVITPKIKGCLGSYTIGANPKDPQTPLVNFEHCYNMYT